MLVVAGDFNDWGEKLDAPMAEIGLQRASAGRRAAA
jgi:endonuclease/exonuclease/phosphatase (EEP) superfamily protein YafD